MNKILFLSALVFAAACGGKSGGGTDPCKDKKMAAMTCDGMADNVAGAMKASGDMPEDAVTQMRDMFAGECTSAGWSQEAIDCMAAATDQNSGESCVETSLTEDQKASFTEAMNATSEGMDGGGGAETDEGMGEE